MQKKETGCVRSVKKALAILDFVSTYTWDHEEGASLKEIASDTGLLPTTACNLLKTMEASGYIFHSEKHRYLPGKSFSRIRRQRLLSGERLEKIRKTICRIAAKTGSTVCFTYLAEKRKILLKQNGSLPLTVDPNYAEGFRNPFTNNILVLPSTLVHLAFTDKVGREEFLSAHGISPDTMQETLKEVRAKGFSEGFSTEKLIYSAACPVQTPHNDFLGAMSLHLPGIFAGKEKTAKILKILCESCEDLSCEL